MLSLTITDTINADQAEVNDYIEIDGIIGQVLDIDDQGDMIVFTLRTDNDGETDEYPAFATDRVNLLDLN